MASSQPEPWLRGPIENVHPLQAAVLRSFEMALEDAQSAAATLSVERLWSRPGGVASVGFHLRHIGGSVDRLLTYAEGDQLSDSQMLQLRSEGEPGPSADQLLSEMKTVLDEAARRVRAFRPDQFQDVRTVGRKQLPTTVAGLLVHIAEHTQRHVGQVVTTAKLVQALQ